jgi:sodium/hydrogen exchanger-like protein 6/7/sodium/hydrogen exchanger 8
MNKHHFFKNLFYVILYGVIATLFNFILIFGFSLLLKHAGSIYYPGGNLSQLTTFSIAIYAACISSKDSALVLSFLDFKRTPKLYSILFGECIYPPITNRDPQRSHSVLLAEGCQPASRGGRE